MQAKVNASPKKQLVKGEIYYCKVQSDMSLDISTDHRRATSPNSV